MIGKRKVILGLIYLTYVFILSVLAILTVKDGLAGALAAIGGIATGMAVGVGAIVYGNVQEHRANNK